jgi:hypothetical protein
VRDTGLLVFLGAPLLVIARYSHRSKRRTTKKWSRLWIYGVGDGEAMAEAMTEVTWWVWPMLGDAPREEKEAGY